MKDDARGRTRPMTAAEEKRIIYQLRNGDDVSCGSIARAFRRSMDLISAIAAKHGINVKERADALRAISK